MLELQPAILNAEEARRVLRQAFATVRLISSKPVRDAANDLKTSVLKPRVGEAKITDATSENFVAQVRTELGEVD